MFILCTCTGAMVYTWKLFGNLFPSTMWLPEIYLRAWCWRQAILLTLVCLFWDIKKPRNVSEGYPELWIILLLILSQVQGLQACVTTLGLFFFKNKILFYFQGWLAILAKNVNFPISPLDGTHHGACSPDWLVSNLQRSSCFWLLWQNILELTHLKLKHHVKKD